MKKTYKSSLLALSVLASFTSCSESESLQQANLSKDKITFHATLDNSSIFPFHIILSVLKSLFKSFVTKDATGPANPRNLNMGSLRMLYPTITGMSMELYLNFPIEPTLILLSLCAKFKAGSK